MGTVSNLPDVDVCRMEQSSLSPEFWACLVPESDSCNYLVKIGSIALCALASKKATLLKRKLDNGRVAVRYADDTFGLVTRTELNELIETRNIVGFQRSSGWVDIAKDPIRSRTSSWQFRGLQRRSVR